MKPFILRHSKDEHRVAVPWFDRLTMRGLSLSLVTLLMFAACTPTEPDVLTKSAVVEGTFTVPQGLTGAAWLFLYKPTEGPPGGPSIPAYLTAISATRLETDPRFVFGDVKPNPWKLFGLLDTNANFDPNIDVLSQPSAGDRIGEGIEVNVQPGRGLHADYAAQSLVATEPPAFHLQGTPKDLSLDLSTAMSPLTLEADAVGRFTPAKTHFELGLVDANHDSVPDLDTTGVPALSLTFFLHWLPRAGQASAGTNVVVPMAYNPSPFLTTLNGRLGTTVATDTLQVYPLPQAQVLTVDEKGAQHTAVFGAPPQGDYELIVVAAGGQFWRMPNQLGDSVPSQGTRLHSDRATP